MSANGNMHIGDCMAILPTLPAASVQCCVTSPPYFGLRDYGVDGQHGSEKTPDEFVANLVAVFREVQRVLKNDGTLWLNLGDSYAASGRGGNPTAATSTLQGSNLSQEASRTKRSRSDVSPSQREIDPLRRTYPQNGLKPKDLIGIPWMVAFALRADGWYLRQEIIWAKPNPMPESVTDRCTKSHEHIFLLTKSPKYYFDAAAIAEPLASSSIARLSQPMLADQAGSDRVPGKTNGNMKAVGGGETRNKRSIWAVSSQPFKEAHFATFPPALIEPCILAGSRGGDTVLDPYMGAGTTAVVCERHGRRWIGCELNTKYAAIAERRIQATQPGFSFEMNP